MKWFSRNVGSIQAIAAIATTTIALIALVGVKYQLDAADELQRAQSARDSYRSHLALAVGNPKYAIPDDVCSLFAGNERGAYTAFVDHLIYSAEQMLEVEEGWEATFTEALKPHSIYVCSFISDTGQTPKLATFLQEFKTSMCRSKTSCS